MKKLFLIIIFLFTSFNSIADTKVVFVDLDKVLAISKAGSSILKQLNELNNKNTKNFKNEGKILKEKEIKIISQKNILSEKEFQAVVDELKLQISKYNDSRNIANSNFKKLSSSSTARFLKLINPILKKYADENLISVILQKKNLVMGNRELDITDEIIKIVYTSIKEFKIE